MVLAVLFSCLLTACGSSGKSSAGYVDGRNFGGLVVTTTVEESTRTDESTYSGACFGVVVGLDTGRSTITIQDINTNATTEFTFSGGTYITDKYGKDISISQISLGDIVEGGYDAGNKKMKSLMKSDRVWENRKVTNFSMDRSARTMKIGNTLYEYKNNLVIISGDELISGPAEISEQDELWVSGFDHTVYSIVITKGHGYVSLKNADYFIGGIVTIGGRIAQKITDDMLLVVPEGEYVLEVAKDGIGGHQTITVEKNKEVQVDVGGFREEARQVGSINFTIKPVAAKLYIDGEETDHTKLVELLYDSYKIKVEAEGYITYEGDLLVSAAYQKKEITLGKPESEEETTSQAASEAETTVPETVSQATGTEAASESQTTPAATSTGNIPTTPPVPTVTAPTVTTPAVPTVSAPATPTKANGETTTQSKAPGSTTASEGGRIHVEAPVGASVYLDGVFQGVAPVSFPKTNGEHTIVLKQNGYETKTYTVNISENQTDSHYSYPALVPE